MWLLPMKKDANSVPDFGYLKKLYAAVHSGICAGVIKHATVIEQGGIASAAAKCCFGNGLGFSFALPADELFEERYGDIIVCADDVSSSAPTPYISAKRQRAALYAAVKR